MLEIMADEVNSPVLGLYSKLASPVFTLVSAPDVAVANNGNRLVAVVVSLVMPKAGMSAVVKARKVGAAAAPLDGPAKTVFTAWVVNAPVSVPLLVTGEPETVMMDGSASATPGAGGRCAQS